MSVIRFEPFGDPFRQIDRLTRELARLRDEMQTLGPQRNSPEPPPPHY